MKDHECRWPDHIPRGENPRGVDQGKLRRTANGWRCPHTPRPGDDYCVFHGRLHTRHTLILDWAVYQLSRRRDSFAAHAYDWAVRKDVNNLTTEQLSEALEMVITDRAREGTKKGLVEVSDLVRAVASVQRDARREKSTKGSCSRCLGTGWHPVWDRFEQGRTAVACCTCNEGRSRSAEAANRGNPIPMVSHLPERWTTRNPDLALDTPEFV